MKKRLVAILIAILISISINPSSFAESATRVDISVNDAKLTPDSPAYISSTNRTMVPVSFISQALKFDTTWDNAKREATIKANGKTLVIPMGVPYAYVDGVKTEMDPGKGTIALIRDGRTMVPIKFIASTFDVDVVWVAYPIGGGLVKISTKGFVPIVVEPVTNNYPVVPGNHQFSEGKVLTYDQVPGSKQPLGGSEPPKIQLTDLNTVSLGSKLTIYPKDIVVVKGEKGTAAESKDWIYIKSSGGGAADALVYLNGKKTSTLMVSDINGWTMLGSTSLWQADYLLFYGMTDGSAKMVPMPSKADTNGKVYNSLEEAKREN